MVQCKRVEISSSIATTLKYIVKVTILNSFVLYVIHLDLGT